MFRNYAGILGAWDEPVAAVRVDPGKPGDLNIVWTSPIKTRAALYTVKLESGWFVTFHKPKFDRPIHPGVWNCRVETTDGTAVMERKFLVVPLTHEHMQPMDNPPSVNAARINSAPEEMEEWKENVQKTGESLEQWLDQLLSEFWTIDDVCRTGGNEDDDCKAFRHCQDFKWSTFSPDPKSEIGEIDRNDQIRR